MQLFCSATSRNSMRPAMKRSNDQRIKDRRIRESETEAGCERGDKQTRTETVGYCNTNYERRDARCEMSDDKHRAKDRVERSRAWSYRQVWKEEHLTKQKKNKQKHMWSKYEINQN